MYRPPIFWVAVKSQLRLSDGNEIVQDGKASFALAFILLTGRSTLSVYQMIELGVLPGQMTTDVLSDVLIFF
jgi:hypothetical protein